MATFEMSCPTVQLCNYAISNSCSCEVVVLAVGPVRPIPGPDRTGLT
jgi:hypothetical protein